MLLKKGDRARSAFLRQHYLDQVPGSAALLRRPLSLCLLPTVIDRRYNRPVGSPNRLKARPLRAQRQARENPFSKFCKGKAGQTNLGCGIFPVFRNGRDRLIYGGSQ
jgi:hypothetical protein